MQSSLEFRRTYFPDGTEKETVEQEWKDLAKFRRWQAGKLADAAAQADSMEERSRLIHIMKSITGYSVGLKEFNDA